MTPDLSAIWTVTSFHRGPSHSRGSDEMIVEFRKKASWWQRKWHKKEDEVYKIAFTGRGFEWFQQPRYVPINDIPTKYRLYDLWYEQTKTALFRD